MSNERWQHLERIFRDARALPSDARGEFVARACGEDGALREQVLSLLSADGASGEFMASTALEQLAESVAAEGWSLQPGERVGVYTVVRRLGAGGAGEVWRARDERLGRDVAIKVLLPHVSIDAERLRRFADEARAAGALNHSNILTVYDVGEHEGIPFLVSECLEGQSLRQRSDAGPFRVDEAVTITIGLARGLAAAHARGIVHRDLKPENVFVRSDGGIKILDFGLAKLQSSLEDVPAGSHRTITGVIIGTAAYMAPEQIRGEDVDARADLFALGVMLYEMLTGQRLFRRASTFETLNAVLTVDPPHVSTLNAHAAAPLDQIVTRLIEKSPDARFQSALDLIWALEHVAIRREAITAAPVHARDTARWRRSRVMPWIVAPVLTALVLLSRPILFPTASHDASGRALTRFTWPLPSGVGLGSAPAVSPDSRYIAFVGRDASGGRLYVRDLGSPAAEPIPGTEHAQQPFWSPDSASIGYFAKGRLMKVAWPGGAPVPLSDAAPFPFGGTWSRSGTIVFGPDVIMAGLRRVGTGGGATEQATRLDVSSGDTSHTWPVFLPDGIHFLYFVRSEHDERRGVYLGRLDDPVSAAGSLLLRSDSNVVYVPLPDTAAEGVLLCSVDNRVEARRFDARALRLAGNAGTIAGLSAAGTTLTQPAMLSASSDVLVFAASTIPYGNRIEAVDRQGRRVRLWNDREAQNWPRLSPDGRFLARQRVHDLRNTPDIWVEDLERGTNVRVTTAVEPDIRPVWSPDGRSLAYVSGNLPFRSGKRILSVARTDGTGVVRTYPCPSEYCEPTDWTSRGLLVNALGSQGADVWIVPTEDGATAQPLLAEPFAERDARLSRNGQWVAYVSEESGRPEVSVRSVLGAPKRIAISGQGGDQPVWRADGAELFFVDPEGFLRSVPVRWSRDGLPTFGLPTKLNVARIGLGHWGTPYDVSPDGSRIYFLRGNDDPPPHEIHVVIGWRALLD
jgi:serine/threonine protein kinase/Tol biopolymer transport system component